jgi:hypothetical protein
MIGSKVIKPGISFKEEKPEIGIINGRDKCFFMIWALM